MGHSGMWFQSGGVKLFLRKWVSGAPQKDPRGGVLMVHGMSEHSGRYAEAGEALANAGYTVWAADARGHGKTAFEGDNSPAEGGLPGHCADKRSLSKLTGDIHALHSALAAECSGKPVFIFGHSWGSFLVTLYIEEISRFEDSPPLAGAMIFGTRGGTGADAFFGAPFMSLYTALFGVRRQSLFAASLATGAYNRPFRKKHVPNRTSFDWGTRDIEAINFFLADPLRVPICSAGFYRDIAILVKRIYKTANMRRIPHTLPVYIASGSYDAVGAMGAGPSRLAAKLRELGVKDVELVIYPKARHELIHETNREEVITNLILWLDKHNSSR